MNGYEFRRGIYELGEDNGKETKRICGRFMGGGRCLRARMGVMFKRLILL